MNIEYPVQKPRADIAAAVISNTVFMDAMLALQKTEKVDGVTRYYFRRTDIEKGSKTLKGPAKLALNNMLRYFAKNKVATVERDVLIRFIDDEARTELVKAAGKDGRLTGREPRAIPGWVRDDFEYVTKGKMPR